MTTMNFYSTVDTELNGVKYTIDGRKHAVVMVDDKWMIDGREMTLEEMVKEGIATREGETAGAQTLTVLVNGNVERIEGMVTNIGVKGNVQGINTQKGDILVSGDVGGNVSTNYGNINCGNVSGYVNTNFGNIVRR